MFATRFMGATLALFALASAGATQAADTAPAGVKNIVIVPGAFTDGSTWRVVHDILRHKGYSVHVVQPRIDSLAADADAVYRQLRKEAGPVLLVGSDYGGAVITQAGDRRKVRGLVYVAAVVPTVGESLLQLLESRPGARPELKASWDGYLYMDEQHYGDALAADLTPNRSNYYAIAQVPETIGAFRVPTAVAAWQTKPSWGVIATEDRFYNPALQRAMYQRANATITEIKGSHLVYVAQPEAVAHVIENAAASLK